MRSFEPYLLFGHIFGHKCIVSTFFVNRIKDNFVLFCTNLRWIFCKNSLIKLFVVIGEPRGFKHLAFAYIIVFLFQYIL